MFYKWSPLSIHGLLPEWQKFYEELTGSHNFDQTDRSLWERLYMLMIKEFMKLKKILKRNFCKYQRKNYRQI